MDCARYNEQRGLFYRKEMHWIMKQYKVQVYLPPEALYDIRDAVVKAGGGVIGNYSGCMSWWEVQSCWRSGGGGGSSQGGGGGPAGRNGIFLPIRVGGEPKPGAWERP